MKKLCPWCDASTEKLFMAITEATLICNDCLAMDRDNYYDDVEWQKELKHLQYWGII